ncbi:IS5 family transposase domain protein [Rickettsiales endosymbiont of Paramecium tredecaurelia]|uniref:hypothetical protein n=1 Tax=Candidatus Sarmatiella mevalonica TaxID=2770581 RepID=UPI001920B403|nr:hypothetical protein [Candidatus Sarmatiella mevalonica]MBL3284984.1 IS5 family transposase domain protein [Candidatus Sarmatiella mevalonica]
MAISYTKIRKHPRIFLRLFIYNKIIVKRRIKVENIIAQLKNFRILSNRYRNKCKAYNLKFNIIAGIINFKNRPLA